MLPNRNVKDWIYPLVLVAATLVCFAPLATAEFTSFDDPFNIWQNPHLNPPTLHSIAQYWAKPAYGLYIPLTYTAWGALAKLAYLEQPDAMGAHLNPWVFHAANIALHVVSVLLAYAILARLARDKRAACLGALLFALHPVQVEPVAWCAGMKDLLSGALALAAVWQYLNFARDNTARKMHYALGFGLFILAMLAKPSAMVVPLVVGAIDLLLLRRPMRAVGVALLPWFILSIACAINTKLAQPAIGVTPAPLWARPLVAADAIAFYLYKLLWPVDLAIDYGRRPSVIISQDWIYFTWIIPTILAIVLIRIRKRAPELFAAAIIFVAAISPVLGLSTFLFQHYSTTADHYLYLAMLGPALALAWAVIRFPQPRIAAITCVVLVMLGVRTLLQARVWRNDVALFTRALEVNPDSFMASNNLGSVYVHQGDLDRAQPLFERAIRINPEHVEAYEGLAEIQRQRGQLEQAVVTGKKALELLLARPPEIRRDVLPLLTSIARDLIDLGDLPQARQFLNEARRLRPEDSRVIDTTKLLNEKTPPAQ